MKTILALLVLFAFSSVLQAQVIEVPEDYADLQQAIDAAPPNATILVHGGEYFRTTIDKPLRIVGDPAPMLWGDGDGPVNESPIRLEGPGSGAVVLRNVNVGMFAYALAFQTSEAGISGGGFDALYIYDSVVNGPEWYFVYNTVFPGTEAIDTTVPLVWIERSTIKGSDVQASDVNLHTSGHDAGTAIVTDGTVVVIDSTVAGGNGDEIFHLAPLCNGVCPGGDGGGGIVCDRLLYLKSTFTGGGPSSWKDPANVFCCSGASGIDVLANQVVKLPRIRSARVPLGVEDPFMHAALPPFFGGR